MFGFLKRRKIEREARRRIGIELHRQIKEAFDLNERQTSARLQTSFVPGYIYYFVYTGFSTITGIPGERATDKHLRWICDGVLPNKLYEIFNRQLAKIEIAKGMAEQNRKIRGTQISPFEMIRLFEIGGEAGFSDSDCFIPLAGRKANNLKRYLLGELDDKPFIK